MNGRTYEFIAEVKTASPFGFRSKKTWDELFEVADEYGDMLSIHTDPRWGGSWDLLKRARRQTQKPILAKGIHRSDDDIDRALSHGADWVLVVGRIPKFMPERCVIEPITIQELVAIPQKLRALWNARNLENGNRKKEIFSEARMARSGWLCQASLLRTSKDIHPKADAILVGTHLLEFVLSLQKDEKK